jgi:lipopolysaccharide heptosyltransferase II
MSRFEPHSLQRIALISFGGIGDGILFAPVIAEVRRMLPKAHLTLFVEERSRPVVDLLPHVDAVVELNVQKRQRFQVFFQLVSELRRKHFDAVVSNGSSPFIPLALFLSGVGIRVGYGTGTVSRMLLTAEAPLNKQQYAAKMYFSLAESFLKLLFGDSYTPTERIQPQFRALPAEVLSKMAELVQPERSDRHQRAILVHPGASRASVAKRIFKTWPPAHWASLILALTQDFRVYLVGGPDDQEAIQAILAELPPQLDAFTNLYGKTRNLRDLAALTAAVDALVCVDSAPLHLAIGMDRPAVAMFGPTDPAKLLPESPRYRAVTVENLACRPCLWDRRTTSCENPVCLNVPVAAMRTAVYEVLGLPVPPFIQPDEQTMANVSG